MLKTNKIIIVEDLQKALDDKDALKINQLMALIYPDFNKDYNYCLALIEYNCKYGIDAADLLNFRYSYPLTSYTSLFTFEPNLVKALCRININSL